MIESFIVKETVEKTIEQPQTPVEKFWDNLEKTVEVEPTEKIKQEAKIAGWWDNLKNDVFKELDEYDFDGKDYNKNPEQLNSILEGFREENWNNMDLDRKKEQIKGFSDYVNEVLELKNPVNIEYYNVPDKGDCGSYINENNTVCINEYTLDDPKEAVNTAAHELWHAYQYEKASDPQSFKDFLYKINFENYIRPDDDFDGYKKQLVEAEARAFAGQFNVALDLTEKV